MPHSLQISAADRRQFSEALNRLQLVGQKASFDLVPGRAPSISPNGLSDNPLEQAQHARDLSCWAKHIEALHSLARAFFLLDNPQSSYLDSLKGLSPAEKEIAEVVDEVAVYANAYFVCSRADLLLHLARKFRDAGAHLANEFSIPFPYSTAQS
jgi:hypothetical protein